MGTPLVDKPGVDIDVVALAFGGFGSAAKAVSSTDPMPVLPSFIGSEYETVAAGTSSPQALGATGAAGDFLSGLLIVPATTSPGAVTIKDGSNTAITVFAGGSSSVGDLRPFAVPLGLKSVQGAWQVTTGNNVSVIGVGDFT